jgi:hypothetical protein
MKMYHVHVEDDAPRKRLSDDEEIDLVAYLEYLIVF